ncbi:MAG: helix-turn-helix domain-containing protein [Methanospirillum sp.]|nr:helix-turn-helix domain-containing protein [Methanospirillum sp.]
MTTDTAGAYLAVSVRTIRDMIRRGDLPAIRIGNEYRIDENDIEKYIARNKTG